MAGEKGNNQKPGKEAHQSQEGMCPAIDQRLVQLLVTSGPLSFAANV